MGFIWTQKAIFLKDKGNYFKLLNISFSFLGTFFFFFALNKGTRKLEPRYRFSQGFEGFLIFLYCCSCWFFFFWRADRIKREIRFSNFGVWSSSWDPKDIFNPWVKIALTESSHSVHQNMCQVCLLTIVHLLTQCVFSTVDLDRLNDDVKRYSCTPRNYSVYLREELKLTNVVFFPRCLLVQRCGGNCGCGTVNWKSCTCNSGKTVKKYHEVSHSQIFLL